MALPAAWLREELARVLALITKAREDGDTKLADLLVEAAAKLLIEVAEAEAAEQQQEPAPNQPVALEQPAAQQQQQQQIETDKAADTDDADK